MRHSDFRFRKCEVEGVNELIKKKKYRHYVDIRIPHVTSRPHISMTHTVTSLKSLIYRLHRDCVLFDSVINSLANDEKK